MDKQRFARLLQVYATIQPFRAPDFSIQFVVDFWWQEFSLYNLQQIKTAFDNWIRNENWFPSVAELRKSLGVAAADPDNEARTIVGNIISSIRKFGWCREIEAKEHLGSAAWYVVLGSGGWQTLCDMTAQTQPAITAQMRDLARSYLSNKKYPQIGGNNDALQLQQKANEAISIATESIRDVLPPKRSSDTKNDTSMVDV